MPSSRSEASRTRPGAWSSTSCVSAAGRAMLGSLGRDGASGNVRRGRRRVLMLCVSTVRSRDFSTSQVHTLPLSEQVTSRLPVASNAA